MSIDMTGWQRLSAVGRDKQLSQLPRGGAPKGVQFAIKIKKAQWIDGQYVLDVTVRTFDLSLILAGTVWKLWPSMLPDELQEALDCDVADGIWWLLETEENKKSKTNRTKFHLLDTQQGLDASGPPKPAAAGSSDGPATRASTGVQGSSSERGQPRAGGEPEAVVGDTTPTAQPPAACPHPPDRVQWLKEEDETNPTPKGFYCKDCGVRVG